MEMINHIGVILDGNRRFANANNLSLNEVYKIAEEKVDSLIRWVLLGKRAKILSIYALSYDNVTKRLSMELDPILDVQMNAYDRWRRSKMMINNGIKVKFAGELNIFPKKYQESCYELERQTEECDKKKFYILVGYSGRIEIYRAAEKLNSLKTNTMEKIREEFFKHLHVKEPVDLILRTGGEHRLSDFLPYQATYAELVFTKTYFPAITRGDIDKAIAEYRRRRKNLGE